MTRLIGIEPNHCIACGKQIQVCPQRGRPARFCGGACRAAAYRRRQQDEPEWLPRWPHARGTVRLSEAAAWEFEREANELLLAAARQKRAHRAAQNRARRRWRHTFAVADRLRVLYATPSPSAAAAAAWRDIADAVTECARLKVPGVQWQQELADALRRVAELTPPRITRAEWRRQ
ncbi:MAG: hypothetical protein ABI352_08175, partial [Candidatus Dormibacter sp.]